jgi:GR25 family glycosyltransferase involved in LPS biosynthesis
MKSYVITIKNEELSEDAAHKLILSSLKVQNDFEIERFDAVKPDQVHDLMKEYGLVWNYPWQGQIMDMKSGLLKSAYITNEKKKRIACFLSHYQLWKQCFENNEDILVFEHDALFQRKLNLDLTASSKYDIIALNDPRGATRRASVYWNKMQESENEVLQVPMIDDMKVPQGLPGNSAYHIKPAGAKKLLSLVDEFGMWPNDSIMCRQLMPNKLGVVRTPFTKVQGLASTTSL